MIKFLNLVHLVHYCTFSSLQFLTSKLISWNPCLFTTNLEFLLIQLEEQGSTWHFLQKHHELLHSPNASRDLEVKL